MRILGCVSPPQNRAPATVPYSFAWHAAVLAVERSRTMRDMMTKPCLSCSTRTSLNFYDLPFGMSAQLISRNIQTVRSAGNSNPDATWSMLGKAETLHEREAPRSLPRSVESPLKSVHIPRVSVSSACCFAVTVAASFTDCTRLDRHECHSPTVRLLPNRPPLNLKPRTLNLRVE